MKAMPEQEESSWWTRGAVIWFLCCAGVFVVLVTAGLAIKMSRDSTPSRDRDVIRADDFLTGFAKDQNRAAAIYRGREIIIVGIVGVVDIKPQRRSHILILDDKGLNTDLFIAGLFSTDQADRLSALRPGQIVSFYGRYESTTEHLVYFTDCRFIDR